MTNESIILAKTKELQAALKELTGLDFDVKATTYSVPSTVQARKAIKAIAADTGYKHQYQKGENYRWYKATDEGRMTSSTEFTVFIS